MHQNRNRGHGYPHRALLLLLLLCIGASNASAQPEGLQAELRPAETGSFYRAGDSLTLQLSTRLDPALLPHLYLELNAVDVTELVQWQPRQLSFEPVRPLAPGFHELHLLYYDDQGEYRDIGFWTFEVRHSAALRSVSVESHNDLLVNHRANQRNPTARPDTNAQSHSDWFGEMQTDDWRLQGSADIAYANRRPQSITGKHLDMPRFELQADSEHLGFAIGDQQVSRGNLVIAGQQQRGVSGEARIDALNSTLRVFRMSGARNFSASDGLGLGDRDNRINGLLYDGSWQPGAPTSISLSSSYVSGRVSQIGAGNWQASPWSAAQVNDGRAWNAMLDASFFHRTLRFQYERAGSRYDFDGRDFGFDAVDDHAWSGQLTIDPAPSSGEVPVDWRISADAQKVGGFYRSIAHRQVPGDYYQRRVNARVTRDRWQWSANYSEQENNLDSDADFAITETMRWSTQLSFDEYEPAEEGSLLAILGLPSYSLNLTRMRREDRYTPFGYLPNDLGSGGVSADARFSRERWSWSLRGGRDRFRDHSGWQPDTNTDFVDWQANFDINRDYSLNIGWQIDQTQYRAGAEKVDQQIYTLGSSARLIPGRLSTNLSLNYSQNNAESDPFFVRRDASLYASGQLSWRIREADRHRAGLDLKLRFSRNEQRDRLGNNGRFNTHQVWLELRSVLPSHFPGTM